MYRKLQLIGGDRGKNGIMKANSSELDLGILNSGERVFGGTRRGGGGKP